MRLQVHNLMNDSIPSGIPTGNPENKCALAEDLLAIDGMVERYQQDITACAGTVGIDGNNSGGMGFIGHHDPLYMNPFGQVFPEGSAFPIAGISNAGGFHGPLHLDQFQNLRAGDNPIIISQLHNAAGHSGLLSINQFHNLFSANNPFPIHQ